MRFVGRDRYLKWLDAELARVGPTQGRFLAIRGRRQVGKSRLLTEWLQRQGRPYLYYQALNKPVEQELESFAAAVGRSDLGTLSSLVGTGLRWPSWEAALDALAVGGAQGPLVVVLDELPYLTHNDPSFEATLQAAWDHKLQHTGVLLIVVGSDLRMMESLTSYGRPLYQRVDTQRRVDPLNVAEIASLLELDATAAFDTYLVTGGFPKIVAARAEHPSQRRFLQAATEDEAHPLVHTGEQILAAEFPPHLNARSVLEAIGAGERTWTTISNRTGIDGVGLLGHLRQLADKQVVTAADPRAARPIAKRTRYHVTDPYLRFWLRFLGDRTPDIARGRGDLVIADINASWQEYAGNAVEPLVREAVDLLLPDARFARANHVGSFWTRDHQVQVDLVGTESAGKNERIEFAGAVKWRARKQFGEDDVAELDLLARQVPGWETSTRRVGVSRTGFTRRAELDVGLTAEDLIGSWAR